jgi:hypothetical protein
MGISEKAGKTGGAQSTRVVVCVCHWSVHSVDWQRGQSVVRWCVAHHPSPFTALAAATPHGNHQRNHNNNNVL